MTLPAKTAPRSEKNHSGELNPIIPTPFLGDKPSFINALNKNKILNF